MHKSIHSCVTGTSYWFHQTVGEKKLWKVGEGSWNNQEQVKITLKWIS